MGTARRHDWRVKIKKHNERLGALFLWRPALLLLLLFAACRFNPDIHNENLTYLHGAWVQDSVAMQRDLLQYTLHELKFTADSVYMTLHTVANVQKTTDSCYGNGQWTEYTRGLYVVRGDSLLVEGWYREANGKLKTSGCHNIGKYRPRFKIIRQTADSLVLEERLSRQVLSLRKIAGTAGSSSN